MRLRGIVNGVPVAARHAVVIVGRGVFGRKVNRCANVLIDDRAGQRRRNIRNDVLGVHYAEGRCLHAEIHPDREPRIPDARAGEVIMDIREIAARRKLRVNRHIWHRERRQRRTHAVSCEEQPCNCADLAELLEQRRADCCIDFVPAHLNVAETRRQRVARLIDLGVDNPIRLGHCAAEHHERATVPVPRYEPEGLWIREVEDGDDSP